MASTRAKKKGGAQPSAAQQFSVVVEDIRSQFKVFGEGLQGLREQVVAGFAQVERGFEQVERRFEQVDRRFEEVDRRFEQVDRRFDRVDQRLDKVEHEIVLLKDVAVEHGRGLKEVRVAVERLAEKVDRKVDRAEVEAIVEEVLARPGSH